MSILSRPLSFHLLFCFSLQPSLWGADPTKTETNAGFGRIEDSHHILLADGNARESDPEASIYPLQAAAGHLLEGLTTKPKPGTALQLTIDARIQCAVEKTLQTVRRGAVVVIDPQNGAVLAMASVPSFDPNVEDRSSWKKDPAEPLNNRAVCGFTPGSILKVATAFAGLPSGLANQRYRCEPMIYGDKTMHCWAKTSHGELSLGDALRVSCGPYFFQYGSAVGIDPLVERFRLLGLGERTGIPLANESDGLLPSTGWLKKEMPTESWTDGYTANLAGGQGATIVTPLQMAVLAATAANGGKTWKPRLIAQDTPGELRSDWNTLEGVTPAAIEVVRKGMWDVVNAAGGTGARAKIPRFTIAGKTGTRSTQIPGAEVAGKTGTAQVWRKEPSGKRISENNTWFIGFAPYRNPRAAVCVLVEGGETGGSTAAPLAGKILEAALQPDVLPIEPIPAAKGAL